MDDLDDLLEVRPRLTWYILPRHQRDSLYFSRAGRAVFANWRHQGITVAPRLTYCGVQLGYWNHSGQRLEPAAPGYPHRRRRRPALDHLRQRAARATLTAAETMRRQ